MWEVRSAQETVPCRVKAAHTRLIAYTLMASRYNRDHRKTVLFIRTDYTKDIITSNEEIIACCKAYALAHHHYMDQHEYNNNKCMHQICSSMSL